MIKEFINYQRKVRGLSTRTCEEYEKELHAFATWAKGYGLTWRTIEKRHMDAHITWLTDRNLKPSSIKKRISAVRTAYRWMEHEGLISNNPIRFCSSPKDGERIPQIANVKQIDEYLNEPAVTAAQKEMHCAVALMLETGCRVTELLTMKAEDFDKGTRCVLITGKGNKQRRVYYGERTRKALNAYKRETKGKLIAYTSDVTLRYELYRQLGKYCPHIHPHMLRHTFATMMVAQGMNLKTLSVIMGHSSVQTTEIYVKTNAAHISNEYNKFKF